MHYVISDIHGCYKQYALLLEKINFSKEDVLYILGDVVDRGPEPMKVFLDMMSRDNVIFILGNHDFLMYTNMKKYIASINKKYKLTKEDKSNYQFWMDEGGFVTAEGMLGLDALEQEKILEYIETASLYEELELDGKRYILAHAGIQNFCPDKPLDEYDIEDFIEGRTDYKTRYFDENTYLITGHTPTFFMNGFWNEVSVYTKNGHIAVDCGCAYGQKLAAYCIETGEAVYVK